MTAVVAIVRAVPAVMAAHMMRTMPAMMATEAMMRAIAAMMMAILHLGGQAFTRALYAGSNAWIVERDGIRLLCRRSHEYQACNGGKAEKLFHVHEVSPGFDEHDEMPAAWR